MGKLLVYLFIGVFLFAGGLGASFMLIQKKPELIAQEPLPRMEDHVPADPSAPVQTDPDAPENPNVSALPVPLRGRPMTAEEIFRFGETFRNQQRALQQQQQSIQQERDRLALIYGDIRGNQRELDGLQAQMNDRVEAAEQLLAELLRERQKLDEERDEAVNEMKDFKETKTEFDAAESTNIKKISQWIQGMPAETAATYLKQLSNDGNIPSAIKLLGNIEERNAAQILAAMDDPALVVQLTEAFRQMKQPPKPQRR